MYEKPTLIPVGKGEEVILGVMNAGYDLDATYAMGGSEFADDTDSLES